VRAGLCSRLPGQHSGIPPWGAQTRSSSESADLQHDRVCAPHGIPFGEHDVGIGPENATSDPAPGELLLYPGAVSETELLLPYGSCAFASKAGQFAGNHFATVVEGADKLREVGLRCLWQGAQAVRITES
jgi:hypothetical protein